jgi:hypothetical protein
MGRRRRRVFVNVWEMRKEVLPLRLKRSAHSVGSFATLQCHSYRNYAYDDILFRIGGIRSRGINNCVTRGLEVVLE